MGKSEGEQLALALANSKNSDNQSLVWDTLQQIPSAAKEMAQEAWDHPLQTAGHAALTLGTAAAAGKVFSMFLPARGPAAITAGLVMTLPLAGREYMRWSEAATAAEQPGADFNKISHDLAKGTVGAVTETSLGFLGGALGARFGPDIATSDTALGRFSQTAQRKVIALENQTLLGLTKAPTPAAPEGNVWFASKNSFLETRVAQLQQAQGAMPERIKMLGSAHSHTNLSDGTGTTLKNLSDAKAAGLDFYAVTDHNHLAARDGIKPGDTRLPDQADIPIIASNPKAYGDQFLDAAKVTQDGKFIGVIGVEMGTIGKVGGGVHPTKPGGGKGVEGGTSDGGTTSDGSTGAQTNGGTDGAPEAGIVARTEAKLASATDDAALGVARTHDHDHITSGGRDGNAAGTHEHTDGGDHDHGAHGDHDGHNHGTDYFRDGNGGIATQFRVFEPDGTVNTHTHRLDAAHATTLESAGIHIFEAKSEVKVVGDGTTSGADAISLKSAGDKLNEPKLSPRDEALAAADARAASHHGGVNHINLFDVPTFFEAIRQPKPPTIMERLTSPFRRTFGLSSDPAFEIKAPDVVKYNDGDYKAMVAHLDGLTDTTGKRPVIQLNHPRYTADWSTDLPDYARGRDYGVKSFDSIQAWRDGFGKYASQIEIITGQAMNPKPVETMRSTDLGPVNMAGYIDKGLHVSPTFGRDDHFNLPGGRPAGTEVYATSFTKDGLLDAMRERRTTATTSTKLLSGHMTVNDKFFMGDILDQTVAPDLNIKMHVAGEITPDASYKVSLYGDNKVGDGRLAKPVQVLELKGQDLLDTQGQVAFDQVKHTLGNKSAWYVEVQRKDGGTGNTDYMWTAPIWVEPVSTVHSTLLRGIVGAGTDALTGF